MFSTSSRSAEISPTSTVSKSTRTSSGSTLLTSISLTNVAAGLCAPLRGVVGVFGRDVGVFGLDNPSEEGFLVGESGRGALDVVRGLDSDDRGALYFLVGVAERDMSSYVDAEESGLLT